MPTHKEWDGFYTMLSYSAFPLDVKPMFNENLGGILGGTHC
jgi:hypothetical protein